MAGITELSKDIRLTQWTQRFYHGQNEVKQEQRKPIHFLASANLRRSDFIRCAYPGIIVFNVPVIEPESEDTVDALHSKLSTGLLVAGRFMTLASPMYRADSITGADVMPLFPNPLDVHRQVKKNKPETPHELQTNLVDLYQAGIRGRPEFIIEATSGCVDMRTYSPIVTVTERTRVSFDPDKLKYFFLQPDTTDIYTELFTAFYASQGIVNFTPYDVAGGVPLEFLDAMGIVTHINEIASGSDVYMHELREGLRVSMVGISPKLPIFDNGAKERLALWRPKHFSLNERKEFL